MIPKIPIWCLPWAARKRMAEMQALIDAGNVEKRALVEEVVAEKAAHAKSIQDRIGVEMAESKNRNAISALVRWIAVTHHLDARANETGLTDLLKDFPKQG